MIRTRTSRILLRDEGKAYKFCTRPLGAFSFVSHGIRMNAHSCTGSQQKLILSFFLTKRMTVDYFATESIRNTRN